MSCDCIKEIEGKLTQKMVERNPGCEIVEDVKFENKSWILGEDCTMMVLGNPVLGRFKRGKTIRKFQTQMMPTYCPFCGKKIKDEKGGDK